MLRRAGVFAGLILTSSAALSSVSDATAPPSTTPPTTAVPTTASPTTTVAPPVDLLTGVAWIQRSYASPCSDTTVQMIGGSAVDGASLAVIDDVIPIDTNAGRAVAFLSCHAADGTRTNSTAALVTIAPSGAFTTPAELALGAGARVVAVAGSAFVVETPVGAPAEATCCAPLIRRITYGVTSTGFTVTDDRQVAALLQTVAPPPIAGDGDLVRSGVPAAALCYRWENVYLSPADPAAEPEPMATPSAELQTIRLALIHVTDRWITPAPVMTEEMADVVRMYQQARGLTVDGLVGAETTEALSADLGCDVGEFRQIDPIGLGPRRYQTVADLLAALDRYRRHGSTANASMTAMLDEAGWDAANSMFLGCSRREVPPSGVVCSWSGRTPLQLIGLVDDPAGVGVTSFSILYARSAAPAQG